MIEVLQNQFDPLTLFELRVAKRADELAASGSIKTSLNLMCWLQAEYELLSEIGLPTRTSLPSPTVAQISPEVVKTIAERA